jgi:hypothetical protein
MEVKTCTSCGETKALSEFGTSGRHDGKHKPKCLVCCAKLLREYRLANPERVRERDRKQYIKDREKIRIKNLRRSHGITMEKKFSLLLNTAIKRKEKRGQKIEVFISLQDIKDVYEKQEGRCAYTKLPLTSEPHQLNTISLDRIDSNKHYTVDNIQLVGIAINRMKLDHTEEQFIQLCRLVAENSK